MTDASGAIFVACLLIIASAVFFLRVAGRWITQPASLQSNFAADGEFGDAMTHMLLADMIRRNRLRLPRTTPAFVLSGPQDYPAAFHWLVALFSKRFVERREWVFSPSIEAAHAAVVFVLTYWMGLQLAWAQPVVIAILVTLVWAVTPGFCAEIRRGAYLNERVFGFVFTHAFFVCMGVWLLTGVPGYLLAAIGAAVMVSITSKFGMQALILITPVWAALLGDVKPLAVLVGALLLAPLLTLGYSLFVWRGSWRHTKFYATYLARVGDYVTSFSLSQLLDAAKLLLRGAVRSALRRVSAHPLGKGILSYPSVFVAVGLWFVGVDNASGTAWVFVSLCIAAVVVFVATATDWLKFLGEGERYLEVAVWGSLLALLMMKTALAVEILLFLASYGLVRSIWQWLKHRQTKPKVQTFGEMLAFLGQTPGQLLLCVPGRLSYPIYYGTPHHRHLWWFTNIPPEPLQQRFKSLFNSPGRYPYPTPDAAKVKLSSGEAPTMAVLHKPTIAAVELAWGIDYKALAGHAVFENQDYLIWDLDSVDGV